MCQSSLGSPRRALNAALSATAIMIGIWILLSVSLRIQFPLIAGIFGVTVSASVTHFSGGRGLGYQLLASAATVMGIVIADALSMLSIYVQDNPGGNYTPTFTDIWQEIQFRFIHDPTTALFYILGIISGLFIWRR